MSAADVISAMRAFLPFASSEAEAIVRDTSSSTLAATLETLKLREDQIAEVVGHWDEFRGDEEWVSLLGACLTMLEVDRGSYDAPLPIWPDLDDADPCGRLFYFYLFAVDYPRALAFLERSATPPRIIDATMEVLSRHAATHERKWGTLGVDAGWWMLPILRGEILQIGVLKFHRLTLGVGSLSPSPWLSDDEAAARGPGFRRGDALIGLHIPQGADLSPAALDLTFTDARRVLGNLWPVEERRIATCQSWMMDERLGDYLDDETNLVSFQRRFTIMPLWRDDDDDVLDFVFRCPGVALADLPRTTRLERAIVEVLQRGEHWHSPVGWLDFDGVRPRAR
ncbi:MAG: acyltransferase domain-containing protein [Acidimicrobiales bacterium]